MCTTAEGTLSGLCAPCTGQSHAVSGDGGGGRFLSVGSTEVTVPTQFLLGNPRWCSSVAGGGQQRVHPAGGGNRRISTRGSLDWGYGVIRRLTGTRVTVEQVTSKEGGSQQTEEQKAAGTADVSATVSVRSKASVKSNMQ